MPLPEFFDEHLRRSDEIADLRFTHAKDVAIQDRLTKEIELAATEQQSYSTGNRRVGNDRERETRALGLGMECAWIGSALTRRDEGLDAVAESHPRAARTA